MEHYANRLKALSRDCGYKEELLERQLRDRFATGLNHPELETDLKQKWPELQEIDQGIISEVTFNKIFAIAQSREQAEHDTPPTNVNKIKRNIPRTQSAKDKIPRKLLTNHCLRCGNSDKHTASKCTARNHVCRECNTEGHFESCCIKTGRAYIQKKNNIMRIKDNQKTSAENDSESSDDEEDYVCKVETIRNKDCKQIDVLINGVKCTMDWDPGSTYSIIDTTLWRRIGSPSLSRGPKLKAYGNNILKTKGITDVDVKVNGLQKILPVVVMNNAKPMLFGLQWCEMNFPKAVYSIKTTSPPTTLSHVIDQHKQLFDGKLGKVMNYQVNIHIKPESEPVHLPARPIKFSLKKNVERELDRLVDEGIIEKVDPNTTPIEWATPTVNVLKPNGTIRICGDYRTTLNPVLVKHLHPIPIFDQLRQTLSNGIIFSKIDLKDAYLQFEIAPESKKYLTLSTHKGYFQYNRMPFGIATAPSIFQHFLDQLLGNIPNVAVYFDDIAITGLNLKEHLQTLSIVFDKLQQAGLKVNLKKCSFLQKEIEYLGHTIDKNGIRPTQNQIDAITKAIPPSNSKELRSFLGLVNFYERFVPHLHGLCADLHELTSGRKTWKWTKHENQIFESTKIFIANSKPLIAFNDHRPLLLACDASEKGVGAVLFHKNKDIEQPIAFASRKLRLAESKYSVIDREALEILFGVKKFDQYLRGTKFTLVTDHKPLIHILGTQRNLPKLVNNRLVRWALVIGSYQYDICYRKGENNILADCLSRLPNPETLPTITERKVNRINTKLFGHRIADLHLSEKDLSEKTVKDHTLSKVSQCLKTGWREIDYNQDMKHYYRKRFELSTENNILMWQGRMIIPDVLRKTILTYLHRGHPGISAMKSLARFYVWWPSLDEDINAFVKRCSRCQQNRPNNSELPVFSWPIPEEVWDRVHIDFAGPFEGTYWLILCDALSKWIEIHCMNQITTKNLCDTLDKIFCTFGLPRTIVSDNGPQFTSFAFHEYCKSQGIAHVKSSPYHPRTNGLAERLVRTFKSRMTVNANECNGSDVKRRLMEFLFTYRNTPHTTTGKSPAQMMFGRQMNCLLSNIRPDKRRTLQHKQVKANIETASRNYYPGERVYVKTHLEKSWQPATITARTHKYSYIVHTPRGGEKRRHADHIRTRISPEHPEIRTSAITPNTSTANNEIMNRTISPNLSTPPMPTSSSTTSPFTPEPTSSVPGPPLVWSAQFATPQSTPIVAAPQPRRSQRRVKPPRRLIDEM